MADPGAPPAGVTALQRRGSELLRRSGRIVKQHPVASAAVVVGAVAIVSPEIAAGAAVGAGVTLLLARPERRGEVAGWLDRGRQRLAAALLRAATAVEPGRPTASGPPSQP